MYKNNRRLLFNGWRFFISFYYDIIEIMKDIKEITKEEFVDKKLDIILQNSTIRI